jgi:hypothetical protein
MPSPSYRRQSGEPESRVPIYAGVGFGIVAVGVGLFFVMTGGGDGPDRATLLLNARADSLLGAVRSARAEGDFASALEAAERLTTEASFAGTPWADSASALLAPLRDTLAIEETLGQSRAKWSYNRSSDLETSRDVYHAQIQSENTISLAPPYEGEQRGALYFRTHPRYGRQIYLELERGSLVCPSLGRCVVGVQFDDEPVIQWEATRVGDLSPQMLFILEHDTFVQRVLEANSLRIQPTIFPAERPVFEFDVSGFVYELYSTEPLSGP